MTRPTPPPEPADTDVYSPPAAPVDVPEPPPPSSGWRAIFNWRMAVCIGAGFSSGLPLYVLVQLVPAWLRTEGVDLSTIGLMGLVGLPYAWKPLWAPLLDHTRPLGLGRRRGWALLTQLLILAGLAGFAVLSPTRSVGAIAGLAGLVALFSATQDIALDAHRRELLPDAELGLGNSLFVNAYRLASLVPGSLALVLADHAPWRVVHLVVAAFMGVGILTTALMPEPQAAPTGPRTLRAAVWEPLRQFFVSRGVGPAVLLLAFMLLYKLGDSAATALATPFYVDMGFSMTQIGTVVKAASLWASVVGGMVGGVIMVWTGIHRALWLFGVVQLVSILGFAWLAQSDAETWRLFIVVSFEYLGVGLGTAAFVAFIARNTDPRYTAFQLALLSALTAVPRTVAGSLTGFVVDAVGYESFFVGCFVVALPGMAMLPWVAPWGPDPERSAD